MISTAVENGYTDEEDDSFEKIDGIDQLELSDGVEEQPDNMITLLESQLFKSRQENERLREQVRADSKVHLLLVAALFCIFLLTTALLYLTSLPPPSAPSCPVPEASRTCDSTKCECSDREIMIRPELNGAWGFAVVEGFVKEVVRSQNLPDLENGDEIVAFNDIDLRDSDAAEVQRLLNECAREFQFGDVHCTVVVRRNPVAMKRLEAATDKSFKRGVAFATILTTTVYIAFIFFAPTFSASAAPKTAYKVAKTAVATETEEEESSDDEEEEEVDDQHNSDDESSSQEDSCDEEDEPVVEVKKQTESGPFEVREWLEKTLDDAFTKKSDDDKQ